MAENIITYDPDDVLARTRQILCEQGQIPAECPSSECLGIEDVKLRDGEVRVRLCAEPPQLPPTQEWCVYDIHSVCRRCGIDGNNHRLFEVRQQLPSGKILAAEGRWRGETI